MWAQPRALRQDRLLTRSHSHGKQGHALTLAIPSRAKPNSSPLTPWLRDILHCAQILRSFHVRFLAVREPRVGSSGSLAAFWSVT